MEFQGKKTLVAERSSLRGTVKRTVLYVLQRGRTPFLAPPLSPYRLIWQKRGSMLDGGLLQGLRSSSKKPSRQKQSACTVRFRKKTVSSRVFMQKIPRMEKRSPSGSRIISFQGWEAGPLWRFPHMIRVIMILRKNSIC